MKRILIVLCGLLAFQGYVFAESWQDRAANKTPGVVNFLMILLAGIHRLDGILRIHGL